ncbi:hypothetical protein A9Q75_01545 [Colwellia psychrerythraea]|uniref:Antitoxin Xre/MbcA/ParS-like toxin-binding domain-containing protein n=1 Tax=Colwellia psychrerythraea TaxID=28229 RepID=A0A1Y5EUP9_COLPS|nr:hypothetical protein A9Q75_01545 [Colwellia psychrerythraea]
MNSIIEIERCFTQEELDYLMPLLKKWTRNEPEIIIWFNTYQISACSNQTPCKLCDSGEKEALIQYIKHIEFNGFS